MEYAAFYEALANFISCRRVSRERDMCSLSISIKMPFSMCNSVSCASSISGLRSYRPTSVGIAVYLALRSTSTKSTSFLGRMKIHGNNTPQVSAHVGATLAHCNSFRTLAAIQLHLPDYRFKNSSKYKIFETLLMDYNHI